MKRSTRERFGKAVAAVASMLAFGGSGSFASEHDVEFLLDGVAEIGAPGLPDQLCVYGPDAFPVVVGATGDQLAPVVAAGRWQEGRIVALGHDGYFKRATIETGDTGRLLANALQWAAGEIATPRVGVASGSEGELRAWLTEAGYDAVEVTQTAESLATVDVVAARAWNQTLPEQEALGAFVRAGGGLLTAETAWRWANNNPQL